jgi:hydrogenase maturation protease
MKTIVLGLGNTLLRDDGVGIYTVRALAQRLPADVDVVEAELAGINLLELLNGYDRAFIVDAITLVGERPGTVFRISPDDLRITPRLSSLHDVDLVTAIELGKRLGLTMPAEVVVYAVQAEDVLTLEEGCVAAVERIIEPLAVEIAGAVTESSAERVSIGLEMRRNQPDA